MIGPLLIIQVPHASNKGSAANFVHYDPKAGFRNVMRSVNRRVGRVATQESADLVGPERGGYLREIIRKAEVGEFTLGPMLMALIGSRKRDKKRA
jgi:hypothetical protein